MASMIWVRRAGGGIRLTFIFVPQFVFVGVRPALILRVGIVFAGIRRLYSILDRLIRQRCKESVNKQDAEWKRSIEHA